MRRFLNMFVVILGGLAILAACSKNSKLGRVYDGDNNLIGYYLSNNYDSLYIRTKKDVVVVLRGFTIETSLYADTTNKPTETDTIFMWTRGGDYMEDNEFGYVRKGPVLQTQTIQSVSAGGPWMTWATRQVRTVTAAERTTRAKVGLPGEVGAPFKLPVYIVQPDKSTNILAQ